MKAVQLSVCLSALFALAIGGAQAADFSGRWSTKEFGELSVRQFADTAQGTYSFKDGHVSGTVSGDTFTGVWAQAASGRRCSSLQLGSAYWGQFELHMGHDGSYWKGRWSYCDDPRLSGGEWSGERIASGNLGGASGNGGSWGNANLGSNSGSAGGDSGSGQGGHVWDRERHSGTSGNNASSNSDHVWDRERLPGSARPAGSNFSDDTGNNGGGSARRGFSGGTAHGGFSGADYSGDWVTDAFGNMHLAQSFATAQGTYSFKNGQVTGTVSGDTFAGIWVQSSSGRQCKAPQSGSYFWGKFNLHMGNDGTYWKGRWSYCDDTEGTGGAWNGKRP